MRWRTPWTLDLALVEDPRKDHLQERLQSTQGILHQVKVRLQLPVALLVLQFLVMSTLPDAWVDSVCLL